MNSLAGKGKASSGRSTPASGVASGRNSRVATRESTPVDNARGKASRKLNMDSGLKNNGKAKNAKAPAKGAAKSRHSIGGVLPQRTNKVNGHQRSKSAQGVENTRKRKAPEGMQLSII